MKLLVQWATKHPQGWIELDSSEWAALAKKPVPVGDEEIDDAPGWLSNICIQGMGAGAADHVAVEHLGDSVRVTQWCDDPDDYEPGEFHARVLTFHPLKPDPELGGAINTDIECIIYAGTEKFAELQKHTLVDAELRPWSEFVPPPEAITRHGIWLTDELADAHRKLAVPRGWREWGDVPQQRALGRWRRATGTITYYWRDDDGISDVMPAVLNYKLLTTDTTPDDLARDIPKGAADEVSFAFTTEAGAPNNADWPTGDYRAQLDINANEDGLVDCKVQILRVGSGGSVEETFGTSGIYETVGVHLYTLSSYNPDSGAAGDRYQVRVLCSNAEHQGKLITLGVCGTDSFADGPWTASVQDSSDRDARTAGKVSDTASDRDARTQGNLTTSSDRDARTEGQVTTSSDRDARTAGKVSDASSDRDARTYGGVTTSSDRDARTEGSSAGTQTASDRDARTAGQVADQSSDRDARTAGQVADVSADRDARTAGQVADVGTDRDARTAGKVSGTQSDRDARTAGKVSDSATDRDSRTHGKVSDTASDRDARTYGGTTVSSDRDARTEGTVTGTQTSSDRDARTAGKVTGESSDRDARTQGGITTASDRDARVAGKVSDESSDRDAATKGQPDASEYGGTVTYYMRGAWGGGGTGDDADHDCVPGAYGYKLTKDSAAQGRVKDIVPGTTNDRICFSWTTDVPEPPTPWPFGDYVVQIDVTRVGPDITYRVQVLRIKLGDCEVLETLGTSGDLTGTGIYLYELKDIDPGDSGRFQVRLIADNSDAGAQDIECSVRGTNTYVQGPWSYTTDDSRAARTTGKVTDASTARAARTVGAYIVSSDRDARTAGKTDASSDRDARTEGAGLGASGTRDARTAGKVTGGSSDRDARTAGGTTTSTDRDARTEGQTTVSSDRDARTAGIATTSSDRAARTEGGGWIVSTTRAARLEGVSVPSVSPPGMAHDKHPDPSVAGGRVPQPKFYVVYSEDTTERVRTLFPQSRRKRKR